MAVVSCSWRTLQSVGDVPCARLGHTVDLVGECAYMFGGSHTIDDGKRIEFLNDLYKVSVTSDSVVWKKIDANGAIPPPRDDHASCYTEGHLYLFGGKNQFVSDKCLSGVHRFNVEGNKWIVLKTTGASPVAVNFTIGLVDKRAFAFGGINDGHAVNDLFMFNLNTNEWLPLKCAGILPSPRCDHASEVVNNIMYIFGGTAAEKEFCNDLYCFNAGDFTWYEIDAVGLPPTQRAGHKFVAHHDKDIYLFGGYNALSTESCPIELHKFSLGNCKWKRPVTAGSQSPPERIHSHCAFILHSNMYVIGGIGPSGEMQMDSVYALHLINPSLRKPVLEHILEDFCKEKSSLRCWLPTQKPSVSYEIQRNEEIFQNQIVEAAANKLVNKNNALPLNSQLTDPDVDDKKKLLKAAQAELASAKQSFENDKANLIRLLEEERTEVEHMMQRHRMQNESWWKARIDENDLEREKLRRAWDELDKKRGLLEKERESLKNKGRQMAHVLQQVTNI